MSAAGIIYYSMHWWRCVARCPKDWDMEFARDLQSMDPTDTTELVAPMGWVP